VHIKSLHIIIIIIINTLLLAAQLLIDNGMTQVRAYWSTAATVVQLGGDHGGHVQVS